MSRTLRRRDSNELEVTETEPSAGSVRRVGSGIGLATIGLLDLLALDDITTAGAWMPEIVFLIASVPALITLAYFLVRPRRTLPESTEGSSPRRLAP